ncbi:hypothetical protein [Nocardioides ferulae]|uniref:hypothetical protein n=1 Tax=Nocardioides ferulae TaxID=2340821 RepID=UPI000EACBB65|nr:hypothetical protein [Nocardioides ferulae]
MSTAPLPQSGSTITDDDRQGDRPGGRHPVDVGYLVMGLAFLGLVAIWAVVQSDTVEGDDVRWLLPLPWVLAGAAGLVATTLRGFGVRRRRSAADPDTDR